MYNFICLVCLQAPDVWGSSQSTWAQRREIKIYALLRLPLFKKMAEHAELLLVSNASREVKSQLNAAFCLPGHLRPYKIFIEQFFFRTFKSKFLSLYYEFYSEVYKHPDHLGNKTRYQIDICPQWKHFIKYAALYLQFFIYSQG